MAVFHDNVGFLIPDDNVQTGIADYKAVEKPCYGTILEDHRRWVPADKKNDDLVMDVQIEITANTYIRNHIGEIAYIHYLGQYWKVESIRPKLPKITLNVGGVWHGKTATPRQASRTCT